MPFMTLEGGSTFDLREDVDGRQWNILKVEDRNAVSKIVEEEKPYAVIGSPPCVD